MFRGRGGWGGERQRLAVLMKRASDLLRTGPLTDERLMQLQALGLTMLELEQMLEEGEYVDEPANLAFGLAAGRGAEAEEKGGAPCGRHPTAELSTIGLIIQLTKG